MFNKHYWVTGILLDMRSVKKGPGLLGEHSLVGLQRKSTNSFDLVW